MDLKEGVEKELNDKYVALRIRQYSSSTGDIGVTDNIFVQEQVTETFTVRKLKNHPFPVEMETEWPIGGCPFGHA